MYTSVRHILPMTLIRRSCVLPAPGKVLVRAGQTVSATDVVAEVNLHPEYILLDIARGLGMSSEKADKQIQCRVGDPISAGDLIAGPVGLGRRVIRAPKDGRVVLTGGGQVLIEPAGAPFQVLARIPGSVVDLIPEYGAVIETGGALIQGVWGNGKLDFGALRVIAKSEEVEVAPADLDVSMRGAIVLAGFCSDAEVLKVAESLPLRGLILSGMEARLISFALQLSLPVIVLEGFGRWPHNPAAYKLLSTNEGRSLSANAEAWDPYQGKRPEVVIPLPVPGNVQPPPEDISPVAGTMVRILRQPSAGETGEVLSLRGNISMPGGVRAQAAVVRLENGGNITIPLANLESIA